MRKKHFRQMARLLSMFGAVLLIVPPAARASDPIDIQRVGPSTLFLSPGGPQGQMVISATNRGPQTNPPITLADIMTLPEMSMYPLSMPPQPLCGPLLPGSYAPIYSGYRFSIGPFAPGERVVCRINIARASDAASDLGLGWVILDVNGQPDMNAQYVEYFAGSLVDVSLSSTPLTFAVGSDGHATGITRLIVTNHGPSDVAAGTNVGACTDNVSPSFYIDGNFEGGCGIDVGNACFDSGFGFALPALPSGQSASCLLKLTSVNPYAGPLGYPIYLGTLTNQATGGELLDIDSSDNFAYLMLAPVAAAPATPVPALSRAAAIALAFLLTAFAPLSRKIQQRISILAT